MLRDMVLIKSNPEAKIKCRAICNIKNKLTDNIICAAMYSTRRKCYGAENKKFHVSERYME
jgi:hypothetical protein